MKDTTFEKFGKKMDELFANTQTQFETTFKEFESVFEDLAKEVKKQKQQAKQENKPLPPMELTDEYRLSVYRRLKETHKNDPHSRDLLIKELCVVMLEGKING